MTSNSKHTLTQSFYTLDTLRDVYENAPRLYVDTEVSQRIDAGAHYVRQQSAGNGHIYGVNTGFGALCETRVSPDSLSELQHNHIVSHACGVGSPLAPATARMVTFLKMLTFRSGHTGVSMAVVRRLVDFWNNDIIPVIPHKGTVGASGDLAPLAHMSLPLLGLGEVWYEGRIRPSAEVLDKLGWTPLSMKPKEGLALTNGVQFINAVALAHVLNIEDLIAAAEVIAALSIQAFSTSETFYDPLYHTTSLHPERGVVARNLRNLLQGSNHFRLSTCNRSQQDPYSFRCLPQVHAAVRQAFTFAKEIVEKECNSVSDNPLFFPEEDRILYGGNLHGASTAMALDLLAIAVTDLSSISERRTYQLLSGQRGLPDFLVTQPGLHSGFMVAQYTSAALLNECKVLAAPASVDTIPTCHLQEDHVSMGGTAANKLSGILDNCELILAIEMLVATQAMYLNKELRASPLTADIVRAFRERVGVLTEDRVLHNDIEQARAFLNEHKASFRVMLAEQEMYAQQVE